jgi:hypothetical protein
MVIMIKLQPVRDVPPGFGHAHIKAEEAFKKRISRGKIDGLLFIIAYTGLSGT